MPAATPDDQAFDVIYKTLRDLSILPEYKNDLVATRIVKALDHDLHSGLRRLSKCLGITLMFAAEMAAARDSEAVVRSTARDADDDTTTRIVEDDIEGVVLDAEEVER